MQPMWFTNLIAINDPAYFANNDPRGRHCRPATGRRGAAGAGPDLILARADPAGAVRGGASGETSECEGERVSGTGRAGAAPVRAPHGMRGILNGRSARTQPALKRSSDRLSCMAVTGCPAIRVFSTDRA
jgi:hypothetical protein